MERQSYLLQNTRWFVHLGKSGTICLPIHKYLWTRRQQCPVQNTKIQQCYFVQNTRWFVHLGPFVSLIINICEQKDNNDILCKYKVQLGKSNKSNMIISILTIGILILIHCWTLAMPSSSSAKYKKTVQNKSWFVHLGKSGTICPRVRWIPPKMLFLIASFPETYICLSTSVFFLICRCVTVERTFSSALTFLKLKITHVTRRNQYFPVTRQNWI